MNSKLLLLALGSALVVTGAVYVGMPKDTEVKINCMALMKSRFEVGKSAVIQNQDGGLFVLTGHEGAVRFSGFVGPRSAQTLETDMIQQGLVDVSVSTEGQCVSDSGLVYTLVKGEYSLPPKPQPEKI